jgi:hypothetical protein
MKFLSRLVLIALIAGGAYLLWQKYNVPLPAPAPTADVAPVPLTPHQPDLSVRTWTNQSGRSFEGELVSAKNDQVIIRRQADSVYFLIAKTNLSPADQVFVERQINIAKETGAFDSKVVSGVHTLSRKLDIKGYTIRIMDQTSINGWRTDRHDPVYWFLLSTKLHDPESGEFWVRVNEVTYKAHKEGALLSNDHLRNFLNAQGEFAEKLPWPRPAVTPLEAQYGVNGYGYNVTSVILKLAANNQLPVEIQPELFGLPSHHPAAWELTVAWRTATGEIRRTIRDGSVLTWP